MLTQNVCDVPLGALDADHRHQEQQQQHFSPGISSGSYAEQASRMNKQACKVFVGGLSWETTDERLRAFFSNFGEVLEAFVSYDRATGRPRGFGFVVFEDASVAEKVVSLQHTIDRREVEAKRAVPKEENPQARAFGEGGPAKTKKVFVGGLPPSVDESVLKAYFERFGEVEDAVVMYDHDNKRPRGFGFITFSTEEAVEAVFSGGTMQTLHDKPIEIKRAVPRDQMGPQTRGASLPVRGGFYSSAPRALGASASRPVGYNISGAAAFSPTAMAGRSYSGLSLGGGGLNGSLSGQDFSRSSSDLLQQMTALSLASGGQMGLGSLAQGISQGLAAQALSSGGGLGGGGLSLGPSNILLGSPGGQAQQGGGGGSLMGSGRLSLGDGFGALATQRSGVSAVSPTAAATAALRQNSLDEAAYHSAYTLGGGGGAHEPPPPLQQPPLVPQQQQQQHSSSLHGGAAFASSQGLQGFRDEAGALAPVSTLSRDLSGAFSGAFTPHKEQGLTAEHQWSLSS